MAPLRTALTTTALRRATQRFVSGDGKSIGVTLVRVKISLSSKLHSLTLSSMTA
jgi:hypothetical protein